MTQKPEDELDAMLRQQPYLEDGGFTQRVLVALPRRRPGPSRGRILTGFALAAFVGGLLGPAAVGAEALRSGGFGWPMFAGVVLTLLVLAGTALSVAQREAEQ